jgi:hypothetical protein
MSAESKVASALVNLIFGAIIIFAIIAAIGAGGNIFGGAAGVQSGIQSGAEGAGSAIGGALARAFGGLIDGIFKGMQNTFTSIFGGGSSSGAASSGAASSSAGSSGSSSSGSGGVDYVVPTSASGADYNELAQLNYSPSTNELVALGMIPPGNVAPDEQIQVPAGSPLNQDVVSNDPIDQFLSTIGLSGMPMPF